MATVTARPRTERRRQDRTDLVDVLVIVALVAFAVLAVLPLLAVALPVCLACAALRPPWPLALGVAAIPAAAGVLWAWRLGVDPRSLPFGFVDVQLDAAVALARTVRDGAPFPWWSYTSRVWPYAVGGGGLLGALGFAFLASHHGSCSEETRGNEASLTFRDAGDMARTPEKQMSWAVPRVVGRGVVSLLSAPPGLGKGWWTWGMLRAMQDGGEFFGMPVRRPSARAWWQRTERPLRVLWLTEEGQSFGETARRFGIKPGLVTVLQRQDVQATDWPTIVALVRREAWRRGCAYVVVDTVRAWCPQAEQTNELAAEVFNLARKELAGPGLGLLFVHHDRKGGGEYGEGVAGPNNLVGSTDVLIELKRVRGDPNARRMLVSRRFGDMDVTATLDGVRYVVGGDPGQIVDEGQPAPPVVPLHLQATLEAVRQTGEAGATVEALQAATKGAGATLAKHLASLKALGLVASQGAGTKRAPLVWRATVEDAAPAKAPPPTSDPKYTKYLNSKAWQVKRAEILERAGGVCEECNAEVEDSSEVEVHHLTYERIYEETPEDLIGLCSGCHRRAHSQ